MKRRDFLQKSGLAAAACWYPTVASAAKVSPACRCMGREISTDVCIVGGGLGGCAAAMAAIRMGARVVMVEPTDWIGGQLTQQIVPLDEHAWIESEGCTKSYRQFRNAIREYYRSNYPLTECAKNATHLNPGNGSVSRLCHEPRVALAVLQQQLAKPVADGRLTILLDTVATKADVCRDRVCAVTLHSKHDDTPRVVNARYFIDATETGDLLPLTGTEYVTGSESAAETGEEHASATARPGNVQAATWCYPLEYDEGRDHTIDKPEDYNFWKTYIPALTPEWSPHPLLSLWYSNPYTLKPKKLDFLPPDSAYNDVHPKNLNLWKYRRIIDKNNFSGEHFPNDISIINWPQNDYMLGGVYDVSPQEREKHLRGMRQLSLSLLYWLQTDAPRPDGKQGWKGLRLRGDVTGTADGLAKHPYIRESRRLKAQFTVTESHIRPEKPREINGRKLAENFCDSVGVGHYILDLHPTVEGDNYLHVDCCPFQIPLGALLPCRMKNLLAGCKNLGVTHISNGPYRVHPAEWNIGEAAGELAAYCVNRRRLPRTVRCRPRLLNEYQSQLVRNGFQLDWEG